MVYHGKYNLLGVHVDAIDSEAAVARVISAARARRPLTVSALAVHGVMTGALDRSHRYRLNQFDLVCPDGQPVRWGLNLLYGVRLKERVYGPDLMLEICRWAAAEKLSIFLIGGSAESLDRLSESLRQRIRELVIAGVCPSKFRSLSKDEWREMTETIRGSGASIAFVGLGCPRQEVFAYEARGELGVPMVAVGAAFNFHSGLLPQAPKIMQRWGLEWVFRLANEPRRLWRRYLLLNPAYLLLLVLQLLGIRTLDADGLEPPESQLLFG